MGEAIPAGLGLVTEDVTVGAVPSALAANSQIPERIGAHYAVRGELGRGGMAVVYRVYDESTRRELALKQLSVLPSERGYAVQAAAFEREYHALVQLAHPRIIEVYDYGADDSGRYYTMELLDGGDLGEQVPIPWREACRLFYDVCSSLALLHSRKLVHRDVSPRNIHRSGDGSAKLIDFGAMVPMGSNAHALGTPPFVAPEVLHRSSLDGRADLFSFGATLYYALTGRLAYAARDFAGLHEAWKQRPAPPSLLVSDVPAGLDALVLALVSLDPAQRPRTAFEVMQKLAAIAELDQEDSGVSQAYLSAPTLVGRDAITAALQGKIDEGAGGSSLLRGAPGMGRSRLLDACAVAAKLAGSVVLRVNAEGAQSGPLSLGQALAQQVMEAIPGAAEAAQGDELRDTLFVASQEADASEPTATPRLTLRELSGRTGDRAKVQAALTRWLLHTAKSHPMVILVDDVERADDASLALFASLALAAVQRRLALVFTTSTLEPPNAGPLAIIARESEALELGPLTREQTEALLESVFGDVPQLSLLSERLFEAARGNPRETLELVELLIAKRIAYYDGGRWVLPSELSLADLPSSAADACQRRVAGLSPLALRLAQLFALASHPNLSRADLAVAAPDVQASALDAAITELLVERVLGGTEQSFKLARLEWREPLLRSLDAAGSAERHGALAEIYASDSAYDLERVRHLLAAGRAQVGLELLRALLAKSAAEGHGLLTLTRLRADDVAAILEQALTAAEAIGASPARCHEIRRSLVAISVVSDVKYYLRAAPALVEQLRHDSGLTEYERLGDAPAGQRLQTALARTAQRYAATPEDQRVLDPQAAIRNLCYYVVLAIAHGSRTQDAQLIRSLPALLEPFAPLTPLVHALWQNAVATRESMTDNLPVEAHERWQRVLGALEKVTAGEAAYVPGLRTAIHYGMGLIGARMGFSNTASSADLLDGEPTQRVSAMSLRRIAHLHRGDAAAAERRRKDGELLALHSNVRPMFYSTLSAELVAYAMASDLTGVRQVAQSIRQLAARFPGWRGYQCLADGYFEQMCGRAQAARQLFERGLALAEPAADDPTRCTGAWPRLEAAYIELLVELGQAEEARARGENALVRCAELGVDLAAFPIRRALALAEGKLRRYEAASERLAGVLRELERFEIRGVELGATHEARTRIALWNADAAAVEAHGRRTAEEYRYGQGSALGARYERLMDEAQRSGVAVLPRVADLPASLEHTSAPFTHSRPRTLEDD